MKENINYENASTGGSITPSPEKGSGHESKVERVKRELSKGVLYFLAGAATFGSLKNNEGEDEERDSNQPIEQVVGYTEDKTFENKIYDTARDEIIKIVRETPPNIKEGYKTLLAHIPELKDQWRAEKMLLTRYHFATKEQMENKRWLMDNFNNVMAEMGQEDTDKMFDRIEGKNREHVSNYSDQRYSDNIQLPEVNWGF